MNKILSVLDLLFQNAFYYFSKNRPHYFTEVVVFLLSIVYYHKFVVERGAFMTAKQRILALKYLEKQKKNKSFAKKIGLEVKMKKIDK